MSLTQFAILKAVAKDKPLKLADGDGLHLLVKPNGSKLWRFRYRFAGRENMMALGAFPATSLTKARAKHDQARKLIESGSDPSRRKNSKDQGNRRSAKHLRGGRRRVSRFQSREWRR